MAGVVCAVMPRIRIGSGTLALPCSPLLCPALQCVRCHSIVDLVWCLCDRVVSLWNSGDGLCGAEGRGVSTVHCQLFMCCGACFSVVCVLSCRAVLWVVEWRGGVGVWVCSFRCLSCLPFSLSSSSSFLLCVGVRGSARAAMRARTLSPNTIVSSAYCSSSPLSHSPPFLCC